MCLFRNGVRYFGLQFSTVTLNCNIVCGFQLNNLAMEQDTYNLKRECEEKDVAIK